MSPLSTAVAAALLWGAGAQAAVQEASGTTATGQAAGSAAPAEPVARPPGQPKPRKPSLFDVIKVVVPPLIDAATSKPPPKPAQADEAAPAQAPAAATPAAPVTAPAAVPIQAPPAAVVVTPPPPAAEAEAGPAASPPPPATTPTAAPPIAQAPAAPPPPPVSLAPPAMSRESPAIVAAPPVRGAVRQAEPVPALPKRATYLPAEVPWVLLGLLLLATAGSMAVRARQLARTRALLSLVPRLDPSVGQGSISGLTSASLVDATSTSPLPRPGHG